MLTPPMQQKGMKKIDIHRLCNPRIDSLTMCAEGYEGVSWLPYTCNRRLIS